ncbi:MAG: N-acetylmuramidase domain-containing protein [Cytophagales bacterium]|nr:N-acetylmuramidase domain-containing protein [Cytophagales bacterium]
MIDSKRLKNLSWWWGVNFLLIAAFIILHLLLDGQTRQSIKYQFSLDAYEWGIIMLIFSALILISALMPFFWEQLFRKPGRIIQLQNQSKLANETIQDIASGKSTLDEKKPGLMDANIQAIYLESTDTLKEFVEELDGAANTDGKIAQLKALKVYLENASKTWLIAFFASTMFISAIGIITLFVKEITPDYWVGIATGLLLLVLFSGLAIYSIFILYVANRTSLFSKILKWLSKYNYLQKAAIIYIVSLSLMVVILAYVVLVYGRSGAWDAAVVSTVFVYVIAFFGIRFWYKNIDSYGRAVEQRKNPYRKMFFGSVNIISMILLAVGLTGAFLLLFSSEENNSYEAMGLVVIIIWAVIFLRYFIWAIYHYNINFGLTDKDWDEIFQARRDRDNGILVSEERLKAPKANPYRAQTFGLPPGTIRGMIAVTLLFGAIAMLIVSMGMNGNIDQDSFFWDHFEFYKTAFLMMIAFYFGDRSLKYLQNRWPSVQQGKFKEAQLKKNGAEPNDDIKKEDEVFAQENGLDEEEEEAGQKLNSPSDIKDLLNTAEANVPASVSEDLEAEFVQIKDLGVSKELDDNLIQEVAEKSTIEPAALKAIIEVESSGSGFLNNGKPKILFEGHRFWSWLEKRGHNPERLSKSYPDLIYKRWTREHYLGGQKEYTRFQRAYKIDPVAAVYATSWGLFQIMGENFHKGGNCANRSKDKSHFSETENKLKTETDIQKIPQHEKDLNQYYKRVAVDSNKWEIDPDDFIDKMEWSELNHLNDFLAFIGTKKSNHAIGGSKMKLITILEKLNTEKDEEIIEKLWRAFAYGYNGSGYETHGYHIRLKKAFQRYQA